MRPLARIVVTCTWAAWCRRAATGVRKQLGNGDVIAVCSDHAGEPTW